jgi:peptide/nickel transport system substrate-binding protein
MKKRYAFILKTLAILIFCLSIPMVFAEGDFNISVSPSSGQLTRGILAETHIATVYIASIGGFNKPVSLYVSSPSPEISARLEPNIVIPPKDGTATSKLIVSTTYQASPGVYTLTITGSSNSIIHQAIFTLNIVGPCFIATATYGSELTPEVQFLRSFRDGKVMRTFAGSQFMAVFNAWYYSFSPYVADIISKNVFLKDFMKIALYPLIKVLQVSVNAYSMLNFNPELAIVFSGFIVSFLIGIVYFFPSTMVLALLIRKKYAIRFQGLKLLLLLLFASIALIAIGELMALSLLMTVSTAMFVLVTIALSIAIAFMVLDKIKRIGMEVKK